MNVADSEQMLAMLEKDGYRKGTSDKDSDLIILNTCHIREKARHKVVSRLGKLKELKEENPNLKIAVTGCVAQAEGKKLLAEQPVIDLLVGPGKIADIPDLLKEIERENADNKESLSGSNEKKSRTQKLSIGFKKPEAVRAFSKDMSASLSVPSVSEGKNEVSRFVNIQQGCNNFCTFCVVPFTRGREVSEHPDVIIQNARKMIDAGAKEITLLGQNVNSYGIDLVDEGSIAPSEHGPFYDILKRTSELDGLERLRFTTSNPHDFTKPLADLFKQTEKMGRYIHLPVQSGSDEILTSMKRKVTRKTYLERIDWLKEAVPDMAISTDIIVGFPGETDDDFDATYSLVKEIGYSFIFAFKYSPRKGTAAPRFKKQIDEAVKSKRLYALNDLQNKITTEQNENEIGRTRQVLVLYESKKDPGSFYGRTPHYRLVKVKSGRDITGELLNVEITGANKTALEGRLV